MKINQINKVGLAVFKDQKVLMARSGRNAEIFYTLGGKVEAGEDDGACVVREVREEASTEIIPGSLNFLEEFKAYAHDKPNTIVNLRLYTATLASEPSPGNEVVELSYLDTTSDEKHLSDLTKEVFAWLQKNTYIR
jgi:8-oxo-dGTP diphosphatase